MWIKEIEDENGKIIDQLQYQQIVNFEFIFRSIGTTSVCPHIKVNTLRREKDIPIDKRLPPIELPTAPEDKAQGVPAPIV